MKAPAPTKEMIAEGNYVATLHSIIYIGTIDGEWKGVPNSAFKVNLTWELNDEMKVWKEGEEAKPVVHSAMFTLSMAPKSKLRPIIEGMIGGMTDPEAYNYDLNDLLGKSCLLNITHGVSETGKDKIDISTSKLMKSMVPPTPFNKQRILSYFDDGKWDQDYFDSLPSWLREKMAGTPEYKTMMYKIEHPAIDLPKVEVKLTEGEADHANIPF